MMTLEAIFGSAVKRYILFEDDLWCIYRRSNAFVKRPVADQTVFIVHRCKKGIGALSDGHWRCMCGKEAPASIKTLFILHQWDK